MASPGAGARCARGTARTVSRREIRFGGAGGQGLILSARVLLRALAAGGRHVAQSQSYEPTSRGGFCHSDLVVDDRAVDYPLVTALDCLVLLDRCSVAPSLPLIRENALVLADDRQVPEPPRGAFDLRHLPFSRTALELGNVRATNVVALGTLAALGDLCPREALETALAAEVPAAHQSVNMEALAAGYRLAGAAG